jgi:hypothetical protein
MPLRFKSLSFLLHCLPQIIYQFQGLKGKGGRLEKMESQELRAILVHKEKRGQKGTLVALEKTESH